VFLFSVFNLIKDSIKAAITQLPSDTTKCGLFHAFAAM
jgi:hypothetical protein